MEASKKGGKSRQPKFQIYFKNLSTDEAFKISTEKIREIFIRGISTIPNEEFIEIVVNNNIFGITKYDPKNNVVYFHDAQRKKKAIIVTCVNDSIDLNVNAVYCFITTKERVMNASGTFIQVHSIVKVANDRYAIIKKITKDNVKKSQLLVTDIKIQDGSLLDAIFEELKIISKKLDGTEKTNEPVIRER